MYCGEKFLYIKKAPSQMISPHCENVMPGLEPTLPRSDTAISWGEGPCYIWYLETCCYRISWVKPDFLSDFQQFRNPTLVSSSWDQTTSSKIPQILMSLFFCWFVLIWLKIKVSWWKKLYVYIWKLRNFDMEKFEIWKLKFYYTLMNFL